MTKLRISSHKLEVEKGRHQSPIVPIEKRLCKVCDRKVLGDEFHAIMKCPKFDDIRQDVFNSISNFTSFDDLDDEGKFTFVMSLGENDTEIAKFVSPLFSDVVLNS